MSTVELQAPATARVRLKDMRPLTEAEFERAVAVCGRLKLVHETKKAYIAEHGLDPAVFLGDGNWSEEYDKTLCNDIYSRFRSIVDNPRYDVLNYLRLHSQLFSGYQLATMALSEANVPLTIDAVDTAGLDAWLDRHLPQPDFSVERYLEQTRGVPKWLVVRVPQVLGEIGWELDGAIVNYDVSVYQERLNLLYHSGLIDRLRRKVARTGSANVLEIGAGYGGLAYMLKRVVPEVNYYICDLPESLLFSAIYLGTTLPEVPHCLHDSDDARPLAADDHGVKYIPNYRFDEFVALDVPIDLALNTLSFSEMSVKQVDYYGSRLSRLLRRGGVLFEDNQDNRPSGWSNCKDVFPRHFNVQRRVEEYHFPGCRRIMAAQADIWWNGNPLQAWAERLRDVALWPYRLYRDPVKYFRELRMAVGLRTRLRRFAGQLGARPRA